MISKNFVSRICRELVQVDEHPAGLLEKFQNYDGGFGHGMEPDFHLPDSGTSIDATVLIVRPFLTSATLTGP